MTNKAKIEYDEWHDKLPVDLDIDTPWHNFVRSEIEKDSDLTSKKILEIGCGRGGFAIFLSKANQSSNEIVACDFSNTAVEKGEAFSKSLGINNITWRCADIQAIPFTDASFDVVISCETIEHVPDPFKAVQELSRVLKPGGKLILTTPSYMNFVGLYRLYLRLTFRKWTEMGQPINNFTYIFKTLRWLKRAGLTITYFTSIDFFIPWKPKNIRFKGISNRGFIKYVGLQSFFVAHKVKNF